MALLQHLASTHAARALLPGVESSIEQAGGLLEQWVAAWAAASLGHFERVLPHTLGARPRRPQRHRDVAVPPLRTAAARGPLGVVDVEQGTLLRQPRLGHGRAACQARTDRSSRRSAGLLRGSRAHQRLAVDEELNGSLG